MTATAPETMRPGYRTRSFGAVWTAQTLSSAGDRLFFAAAVWFATARYGTLTGVTVLGLAQFLPTALLAPITGVLVDRLPRGRLLFFTDLVRFFVSLAMALDFFLQGLSLPALVGGIVILRIAGLMFSPSLQSLLGTVARGEGELLRLDAWILSSAIVAGLMGPALASLAVGIGATFAMLLNAVSFLLSVASLGYARTLLAEEPARAKATFGAAFHNWGNAIREGMVAARRDKVVTRIGPTLPIIDLVGAGVSLLLPSILLRNDIRSGLWYGLLTGTWAAGRFIGLFTARRFLVKSRKGQLMALNAVIQGAAVIGMGVNQSVGWMVCCFLLLGIPSGCASVCVSAYIQTSVEKQYRGRIFSLLGGMVALAMPLGPVFSGLVSSAASPTVALLALGVGLVVVGLLPLFSRTVWRLE